MIDADAAGRPVGLGPVGAARAGAGAPTGRHLAALVARRREIARLARRVLVEGEGDHGRLRAAACGFLRAHPELHHGVVLSLHLGPYSLIPGLYLDCGLSPVVLLDREAHDRIRPEADRRRRELRLPGELTWLTTDRPAFAGRMLRALRAGRPVLVYLDGNSGAGGMEATRERGMPYRLPGRMIRVRTGLGRLVLRSGAPLHTLTVRWRPDGGLDWEAGAPSPWPPDADPQAGDPRVVRLALRGDPAQPRSMVVLEDARGGRRLFRRRADARRRRGHP